MFRRLEQYEVMMFQHLVRMLLMTQGSGVALTQLTPREGETLIQSVLSDGLSLTLRGIALHFYLF